MRRSFAILVALVLSLGLVLPAFAQSASSVLPACCRRTGAHHCSMGSEAGTAATSSGATWSARSGTCPLFPHALAAFSSPDTALWFTDEQTAALRLISQPLHADTLVHTNRFLLHEPGRGPPASLSV